MKISKGATRIVFMFSKFVIKIPRVIPWKNCLVGMLANLQEREFNTLKRNDLAPIFLSSRLGLFVIMKRAKPIENYTDAEFWGILDEMYKGTDFYEFMLSDYKMNNYGIINGKIVKIDYGN